VTVHLTLILRLEDVNFEKLYLKIT
jgi:hypothetical protein